ncbi:hypothetical protein E3N88_27187 [Mikania micrantha]|uniref:Uncharacterized protein n=1 Tax=Mikania micrantha TaxID=192012 RepID=A0A5N6MWU6_9ASTR|nr:hypothetical protein E3N88_27187 [Mikania micrantha]
MRYEKQAQRPPLSGLSTDNDDGDWRIPEKAHVASSGGLRWHVSRLESQRGAEIMETGRIVPINQSYQKFNMAICNGYWDGFITVMKLYDALHRNG